MSLDSEAKKKTRSELAANLDLAQITSEDIVKAIGLSPARVDAAFAVLDAQPEDVWLVRDYLDRVILSRELTPVPYSSLSERMRSAAQTWFPLVDVDSAMEEAAR